MRIIKLCTYVSEKVKATNSQPFHSIIRIKQDHSCNEMKILGISTNHLILTIDQSPLSLMIIAIFDQIPIICNQNVEEYTSDNYISAILPKWSQKYTFLGQKLESSFAKTIEEWRISRNYCKLQFWVWPAAWTVEWNQLKNP